MTIKEQEYAQIRKDFQWLSEMLMLQMEIAQELVVNSWSDNIYEQIIQKKEEIRYLHNQLQDALQTLIVQFSPRAAELRQIVAYYSVMLAMGQINKILIQLVDRIHQSSLIINNYTDNLESVQALFATTQGMVASALFSFFQNNPDIAQQILEQTGDIDRLVDNLQHSLIVSFQNIPLNDKDINDIITFSNIGSYLKKIGENASYIAKFSIFVMGKTNT